MTKDILEPYITKVNVLKEHALEERSKKNYEKALKLWEESLILLFKAKDIAFKQKESKIKHIFKNIESVKRNIEVTKQEYKREYSEKFAQIKNMLEVSKRIRLDMMREALKLDSQTFSEKIFQWAAEHGFIIDGDYIIINRDTVSEFIQDLDRKFTEWIEKEDLEENKI